MNEYPGKLKTPFVSDDCVPENESKFIQFNFRGKVSFVGKDLVSQVPYLNALAGTMANSPR